MNCETQETIVGWAERTFGVIDARGAFLRCAEEFAEMALALGMPVLAADLYRNVLDARDRLEQMPPLSTIDESKARIEGADVYITLVRVADTLRGQLHDFVDDKMVINRSRQWRMVGPGIGQHVKESK